MQFSEEYKAGFRGDTAGVDIFSYSYQMGAKDREKQAGSGGGSEAAGTGGAGAMVAVFAVILAFLCFVAAFAVYPIAGLATGIAFAIGAGMMNGDSHSMNGVGLVFALMVPCYVVYFLCFALEQKTAQVRNYRVFRHYWRIVVGTFFVHTLGTAFHLRSQNPGGAPFSGYVIDAVMTVTGFFLLYLNSMRLDRKYGLEPIRIERLDRIIDPIKDKLIPPVPAGISETSVLRAKTDSGVDVDVAVGKSGIVTLGDVQVPVAKIRSIESDRKHRGLLLTGGIILFFMAPVVVGNMFGDFDDIPAQMFGVAGIAASVYLVAMSFVTKTPAGKLAGPFRFLEVLYIDAYELPAVKELRFANANDERMFTEAVANGLRVSKS